MGGICGLLLVDKRVSKRISHSAEPLGRETIANLGGEDMGRTHRYSNDSISDEQFLLPMQDQTAREMASGLDDRHARQHFHRHTRGPFNQA